MGVIHVDDETHAAAKAFCKEHGLIMRRWVSKLVTTAVECSVVPVGEMKIETYETRETDALERPPFWGKT